MRLHVLAVAAIAAAATSSQAFINGDFETGAFAPWVVTNTPIGTTAYMQVEMFDIDGPGPLPETFAAGFSVGRSGTSANAEGIEMTQSILLTIGVPYVFEFDWAATRTIATTNSQGGIFELIVDGAVIASDAAGATSSTVPHYGHLLGNFTPVSTGNHSVGVRITRPFTIPTPTAPTLFQHVDNFEMSIVPEPATMLALCAGLGLLIRRRRK